jgi:phage/plasmid-associated DNA primase
MMCVYVHTCVHATFISWLLTWAEKTLACAESNEKLLKSITAGNETWIYSHDHENNQQSSQQKCSALLEKKKHAKCMHKTEVLPIVFFDHLVTVHQEYGSHGSQRLLAHISTYMC